MLKELPAKQFLEWFAFDRVEPIGGLRSDWQTAAMCSQMTNVAIMRGGGKHRTSPADFMLEYGKPKRDAVVVEDKPPAKSWQELKFIAQMCVHDDHARRNKKRGKR